MFYQIENPRSGVVLGFFEASSESEALDAMARDAGYADYAECRTVTEDDSDLTVTELVPPKTLKALRDTLNAAPRNPDAVELVAWATAHGLPTAHGDIAYDALPTFGGEAPAVTDGVYSWSEGQYLVRADLWFGEGNQLNTMRVLTPWTLVPRDPAARLLSSLIADAGLSVSAFARAIGRDRGTVEAWLTGETVVPETMRRWTMHATVERIGGGVRIEVAV